MQQKHRHTTRRQFLLPFCREKFSQFYLNSDPLAERRSLTVPRNLSWNPIRCNFVVFWSKDSRQPYRYGGDVANVLRSTCATNDKARILIWLRRKVRARFIGAYELLKALNLIAFGTQALHHFLVWRALHWISCCFKLAVAQCDDI